METPDSELLKTSKTIKNDLEIKNIQRNEISNIFAKKNRFFVIFESTFLRSCT